MVSKMTKVFLMLLNILTAVQTSKILAVYTFPGKSHFMMNGAIIKSLIDRGHEVTAITAITLLPWKFGSNYTEILIEPSYDYWSDLQTIFSAKTVYDLVNLSVPEYIKMCEHFGLRSTELALKQPNIQQIINANETERKFDVMIAGQFYQDAFLALGYQYNIPVITTCTLGTINYMSQMTGIITPWSFVPNLFAPYIDRMTFYERMMNSFYSLYEDLSRHFFYLPAMDRLVDQYFINLPDEKPTTSQMNRNISILLLNSYDPLRTPRPTAKNMIDVGGIHIYPPKALPKDIQLFLDDAEYGAIYFSLGSNVKSVDMPKETFKIFVDVFSTMKQRILWKFEAEGVVDIPKNVMIGKWMPQNDILAHPNVKVFITHGGLFGTQEGIYHAVPMLGFPFYCDQHLNIQKAVLNGYAVRLQMKSFTAHELRDALNDLLENPKYKHSVQKASNIFRDRPMEARDTAIYWIEYVIRHKGAPHLRSAGLELNLIQFYLLDVIGVILLAFIITICITYKLFRIFCCPAQKRLRRSGKTNKKFQ